MRNLLALLLLTPCALLAQVPDYVPTTGLLTWHNLDGDAVDQIGNHTGQLIGTASTQNRFGEEGKALMFSDGEYVELGTYTEIQGLCEFSTSIWYYGGESQGSGCCNMLWCSGFDQWLLNLRTWEPQYLGFEGGLNCSGPGVSTSDANLYGAWNHVVTVLKDGKAAIWLNGELKDEADASSCVCSHNGSMRLGTMDGFPHHFTGMMDDFGVWNRALDETEISTLFIGTPPITGCTDSSACNFDAEANLDDGSCYPCDVPAAHCGPGTHWDSTLEACVVDIPSAEVAESCALMTLQELAQSHVSLLETVEVLDSLLNDCQGNAPNADEATDSTSDNTGWLCGNPFAHQGYDYATVQIGDQCWFAENLRASAYRNGSPIENGLSDQDWASTTQGATTIYGLDSPDCVESVNTAITTCSDAISLDEYGRLYNWYAVNDPRNLCPEGWHVPSEAEWLDFIDWGAINLTSGCFSCELKTTTDWSGGNGSNSLGWNGKAGGTRIHLPSSSNGYWDSGYSGFWWTATESSASGARSRWMGNGNGVFGGVIQKKLGLSVRCLKDE